MNYRHGDIGLHLTKKATGTEVKHNGSFVLAEGETTGHAHRITVKNPDDMTITRDGDVYFITLRTEGEITHEEHKRLVILAGTYEMKHEREFNWFEMATKRVVD